jgi:hypothetical protein
LPLIHRIDRQRRLGLARPAVSPEEKAALTAIQGAQADASPCGGGSRDVMGKIREATSPEELTASLRSLGL